MGTLHDALEYLDGERDIPAHRGWATEADAEGLDLADVLGHRWESTRSRWPRQRGTIY